LWGAKTLTALVEWAGLQAKPNFGSHSVRNLELELCLKGANTRVASLLREG
jgi:hypothetical protein